MARRALMVIAPEQFRDEELLVPRNLLRDAGFEVETVSTRAGECKGMLGAKETVDRVLEDVQNERYDALIVIGGMGSPEYLWNNETLHRMIRKQDERGGVVASICLSGAVLAKAGVLQGKQATVWEMRESVQALRDGGAEYTGEPVTADGNIITANGPAAAESFGRCLVEKVQALQTV